MAELLTRKPLTLEQLEILRAVPLGTAPNRLRFAMALVDVRQSDLVEATGWKPNRVSFLVNKPNPGIGLVTARVFAEYFGCAVEDLFPTGVAA